MRVECIKEPPAKKKGGLRFPIPQNIKKECANKKNKIQSFNLYECFWNCENVFPVKRQNGTWKVCVEVLFLSSKLYVLQMNQKSGWLLILRRQNHMHGRYPPRMKCDSRSCVIYVMSDCFSEVVGRDNEFVNGEYSNFELSSKFTTERG
ncbi:hypothetical protein CEXT_97671 [Caerostris extrusa]|uniref:Uncharacterized protein n=1 Tax=Caerostris extrusa TaxID=172846 RepID=A0AAV4XBX1_CAEEX|nr:hypothetical protein CEXT_97671 [Caerostris extrusa]